jgi:predicted secreted hydrolase
MDMQQFFDALRKNGRKLVVLAETIILVAIILFVVDGFFHPDWPDLPGWPDFSWPGESPEENTDWTRYPYQPKGTTIRFPEDEGVHVCTKEWWYLNFNMIGDNGKAYDIVIDYVRLREEQGREISLTDAADEIFYNSLDVGDLAVDNGKLNLSFSTGDIVDRLYHAESGTFSYVLSSTFIYIDNGNQTVIELNFTMASEKPPMIINETGLVSMALYESSMTYYYSLTHLETNGVIRINGNDIEVTGKGWFDHQWGNFSYFDPWTWMSLKFDNDIEIMVWEFYDPYTAIPHGTFLQIIHQDGSDEIIKDVSMEPLYYWEDPNKPLHVYAVKWRIMSLANGLDITINATLPQQYFPSIGWWGGGCSIVGVLENKGIEGSGFIELGEPNKSELTISNVTTDGMGDVIFVYCQITDEVPITNATLWYSASTSWASVSMNMVTGVVWYGAMPINDFGITRYYIEGYDKFGTSGKTDILFI